MNLNDQEPSRFLDLEQEFVIIRTCTTSAWENVSMQLMIVSA